MDKGALVGQGRTADIFAWGDACILKLFHPGWPQDDIEYEARISRAIHASGVPAPALFDLIEVEGRYGIVYERIQGSPLSEVLRSSPWTLPQWARRFAHLHASMHRRTASDVPSQRRRLEWKIQSAEPLPRHMKESALKGLSRLPDGTALCHGDFHPENIIVSPRGPVVIDWMDAAIGNPLADVARTSLLLQAAHLHFPKRPLSLALRLFLFAFRELYLRSYSRLTGTSRGRIRIWELPVAAGRLNEGIDEEEEWLLSSVANGIRQKSRSRK